MDENAPSHSGPKTFPQDVQLFACKLIDEKILNFAEFDSLVKLAPNEAPLIDFAQLIIDSDICEDVDKLQRVLDASIEEFSKGKRAPYDPFDTALGTESSGASGGSFARSLATFGTGIS